MTARASAILLFLFVVSMPGLATATWIEWYEHEDEVHVGGVLDLGDQYWLYGTNVSSSDPEETGIVVFRVESDGTLLHPSFYDWAEVQGAEDAMIDEWGRALFAGRTTAFGAGGSDMYVLETGDSGQTLSEWAYGDVLNESARRIVLGVHGDYFLVGNQTDPEVVIADAGTPGYGGFMHWCTPYVARIQSSGTTVWKESYRSEANVVVFDAAATSSVGCFVLSTAFGFPNAADSIRLDRLDERGKTMWTRTFSERSSTGHALHKLDSEMLLIAGTRSSDDGTNLEGLLSMLRPTGREVWSESFGRSGVHRSLQAITQTEDGLFVAAGTESADGTTHDEDIYMVCVDFDGVVQWEMTIAMGKRLAVADLIALGNEAFLIAGSGAAAGEPLQAMLLRVDR